MMKSFILIILSCLLTFSTLFAQDEWVVPQDQKEKLSSNEFNDAMRETGKNLFSKNCIACHGTPGQHNFNAQLKPSPGDPVDEKFQKNTDGEIFYKIKEGRAVMPSFKNAFSPQDTWSVIAYLRSFNANYTQEIATKVETNIPEGAVLSINIKQSDEPGIIKVILSGKKDGVEFPVIGLGVKLMAKRYFGNLQVGEIKTTNKNGFAKFIWNDKIPGDTLGNVILIAQVDDVETFGNISDQKTLQIGNITNNPPLNEERAMWNTFKKAPYWILIGYFGAVITVWFFIFYVVVHIKKIYKIGKEQSDKSESLL